MSEAWLDELTLDDCLLFLRASPVGRIGFVIDDWPVVLPVNYRLVETSGRAWVALRTRPGNVIDQAPLNVALQIDGIDNSRQEDGPCCFAERSTVSIQTQQTLASDSIRSHGSSPSGTSG